MREVQLASLTGKALRSLVDACEEAIVYDDGQPVARITPTAIEIRARAPYFTHYPHPAEECLATCWRHSSPGEVPADVVPADAEPAGTGG